MKIEDYKAFAIAAAKVTLFCLFVTGIFKFLGAPNKRLLIVLSMVVMSSAATFSPYEKHVFHVILGSLVVLFSIIIGGVIGYYYPMLATILTILYAGLAFYLPKTKCKFNIFVTSSVMFLIFTALPFSLQDSIQYAFDGVVVFCLFIGFYMLFHYKNQAEIEVPLSEKQMRINQVSSITAMLSLTLAAIISAILDEYFNFTYLYWIPLIVLVIIQNSQQYTIQTSLKKILINAIGAIAIVILFGYVMPPDFWINFLILVIFLYLFFFLRYSYLGRTLFIELFVISLVYLLGDYLHVIVFDRIIFTLISGIIVIIATPLSYLFLKSVLKVKNID